MSTLPLKNNLSLLFYHNISTHTSTFLTLNNYLHIKSEPNNNDKAVKWCKNLKDIHFKSKYKYF